MHVPAPDLWRRDERRLAVPYPLEDPAPTPLERETGCLLVICHALATLAMSINQRRVDGYALLEDYPHDPDILCGGLLASKVDVAILEWVRNHDDFIHVLTPLSREGDQKAAEILREVADAEIRALLVPDPPSDPGTDEPMMAWVVYQCADPFFEDEPTAVERDLWSLLGLLEALLQRAMAWADLRADGGVMCTLLARQLRDALIHVEGELLQVQTSLALAARAGAEDEAELLAQVEERRSQAVAQEDAVVVLAARARPNSYFKIGLDETGAQVAVGASAGSVTIAIGDPEEGKTHLQRCYAEGVLRCLPGLNQLTAPQCCVQVEMDFRKESRLEMLRGFFANDDSGQLKYLKQWFAYTAQRNAAYTHATLLALEESVPGLNLALPAYRERGLTIAPLLMHTSEQSVASYRAVLSGALGKVDMNKPQ